jgi:hypothetical protein
VARPQRHDRTRGRRAAPGARPADGGVMKFLGLIIFAMMALAAHHSWTSSALF